MQNKMISLTVMLLTSVAFGVRAEEAPVVPPVIPAVQQEAKQEVKPADVKPADVKPEVKVENKPTAPTVKAEEKPAVPVAKADKKNDNPKVKADNKPAVPVSKADNKPVVPEIKTDNKPVVPDMQKKDNPPKADMAKFPALKPTGDKAVNAPRSPLSIAPKSPEEIRSENRRRMEEELRSTTTAGKSIVDFPNRSSLGSSELAPLPTINESIITGPAPMAQSVSSKDLPSEQLLGNITPAVFQEMADLERGNTFLKLQIEKEKMKNDLEKLKSEYREKRLTEIAKRENVVKSRIQWWQEQETIRLEIEKKAREAEELAQKIAEQEANRELLRQEAAARLNAQDEKTTDGDKKTVGGEGKVVEVAMQPIAELYTIESIRGVGRKLTAKLKTNADGNVFAVKKDDILPSGHVVREVKKDAVVVMFGNHKDQLTFRPAAQ